MQTGRSGRTILMIIPGLSWDLGFPVAVYYAFHLFGVSDWLTLLISTGAAALRVIWVAVRERYLNPFATIMLLVSGWGWCSRSPTARPGSCCSRNRS